MRNGMSVVDLADSLLASVQQSKTASDASVISAPVTAAHPVALLLKRAAAALRQAPELPEVTPLEAVEKLAMALSGTTGAHSAASGATLAAKPPTLPGLRTSNMGITAGTGGAAPVTKVGAELRKVASLVRERAHAAPTNQTHTAAHVLNAASGLHHLAEGLR